MTLEEYNQFCGALPQATHAILWRGWHVWKIGGKVFVIGDIKEGQLTASFKVSPLSYDILKELKGLRPAPYLASRGMKWIQHYSDQGLSDEELQAYLRHSYSLVVAGLTRKRRVELGLQQG